MSQSLAGRLDRPASTGASQSAALRGSCGGQGDGTGLPRPSLPEHRGPN